MKALLVYPAFPVTFWGFQYALEMVGRRAALPPLGLLTLAALLPDDWELRLVDLNVEPLRDADLRWADVVLTGGMHIQRSSILEVIARARRLGRKVVVGGPSPTTAPEHYTAADVVFRGEAEGRIDALIDAIRGVEAQVVEAPADHRPPLNTGKPPRYDLLDLRHYAALSLQSSRGCPYTCEFCDIIEIFGRVPRVKSPEHILGELDAIHRLGFRGAVLFVDDNFIGNRRAVKAILPAIRRWQEARGFPFRFGTETTINLARDERLVREMVECGFTSLFLGIETPNEASLRSAGKTQNLTVDPVEAVEQLTRAGMEVTAGFILGFDTDGDAEIRGLQQYIERTPIPHAMVGLLNALPGTAMWRRLAAEGRLREDTTGDNFARPNFAPAMDEERLLRGYRALLAAIYSPEGYYARCEAHVRMIGRSPIEVDTAVEAKDVVMALRVLATLILGRPYRRRVLHLLRQTLRHAPHNFASAVLLAVRGEHFLRYTAECVLPRLDEAIAAVQRERAAGERARAPRTVRLPVLQG